MHWSLVTGHCSIGCCFLAFASRSWSVRSSSSGEAERPLLESYFAWLGDSGGSASPITPRRVHQLSLTWPVAQGHLDDELWPDPQVTEAEGKGKVSLEIETLLPLLIPAA